MCKVLIGTPLGPELEKFIFHLMVQINVHATLIRLPTRHRDWLEVKPKVSHATGIEQEVHIKCTHMLFKLSIKYT